MAQEEICVFNDFLRDTPVYQEVLAEGVEKGLEQGLKEGLRTQRQTLLDIVQERFPEVAQLAKKQAEAIDDPEVLRRLTMKMSVVQTAKEAERYLLNANGGEIRH
jgi:flagellar biosynthesis/type III secretory pathway protein FliH